MKLKSILFLLAATFILPAAPTVESIEKRITALENSVRALESKDPDFADWVRQQRSIHNSYKKAIRYDEKYDTYEVSWLLEEWEQLVSRMEKEFDIYKNMPDLEPRGIVNVKDFGAKADGVTNDTPAIQKAIDFAVKNGKGVVLIPKGRYYVEKPVKWRTPIIRLHKVKNLKITGEEGTVLECNTNKPPFIYMTECENVRIENFHITARKPIFASGMVIDYTPQNDGILVKHDGGVSFGDSLFKECEMPNIRFYESKLAEDGKTPLFYYTPPHIKRPTHPINFKLLKPYDEKNGIWVFPFPNARKVFGTGQRLVLFARNHTGAVWVYESDRCRFKKLSFDRVGGLVFKLHQCDAAFVTDCIVAASPEEKFSYATTADFFFSRVTPLGAYVARNTVKNLADDLFNLHSAMIPVLRQEGNVIYVGDHHVPGMHLSKKLPWLKSIDIVPHYGDRLINKERRYKVLKAEKVKIKHDKTYLDTKKTKGKNIVTLEKAPQDVTVIKLTLDRAPGKLEVADPFIKLEEYQKLQFSGRKFDFVHLPDFYHQGTVISSNYFADTMGRIWVMGGGSVLKDNSFNLRYPHSFYCSWNSYMPTWDEAWYPRVVTYENNIFRMSEYTTFCMDGTKYKADDQSTWMRHIFIHNNRLLMELTPKFYGMKEPFYRWPLFNAKGVANLELVNNVFYLPQTKAGKRLLLKDVRGVIKNNHYLGNWKGDEFGSNVKLFD